MSRLSESAKNDAVQNDNFLIVIIFCLLCSIFIIFSKDMGRLHDADSILTTLMSYYRVTLFYWGQNRMASVIPGMTFFVKDVFVNFELQAYIHSLFGFSIITTPFIIAKTDNIYNRFMLSTIIVFFVIGNNVLFTLWLHAQSYGGGCFFLCLSVFLSEKKSSKRWLAGLLYFGAFISSLLGMLLNPTLFILAAPFYGLRFVLLFRGRDFLAGAIHSAAFAIAFWAMQRAGDGSYSSLSFTKEHLVSAWTSTSGEMPMKAISFLVISATAIGLVKKNKTFSEISRICLIISSFICAIIVANMDYIASGWIKRYIYWLIIILFVTSVDIYYDIISRALGRRKFWPRRRVGAVVFLSALTVVALRCFPLTTEMHIQPKETDDRIAPLVAVARQYRTSAVVADDYWLAWPLVYATIAARQGDGEPKPEVFGISFRGDAIRDMIDTAFHRDPDRSLLCVAVSSDECVARFLSYITPFSWRECAETAAQGQAEGMPYRVLRLARQTGDRPCSGMEVTAIWDALLPVMSLSPIAARENNTISVAKEAPAGLVAYGPYLQLGAGSYRASWTMTKLNFAGLADDTPLFRLDAVDDYGTRILASRVLTRADLGDLDHAVASIDFVSTDLIRHCEIRLWRLAQMPMSIDAVRVEQNIKTTNTL